VRVTLKTGDIVLFNRMNTGISAARLILLSEYDGRTLHHVTPLDYHRESGSVFVVNVVVRCIMGFAGPVPLGDLDALQDG
jgi:hypothetical protein